ncbi:MAG: hypothetical protein J0L82_10475 [Deltaproteobacteria bacterium]|jgi:hypothetical protein|nr:hypothetical protein [Deltaproteobacteria bacterium]
MGNSFGREKLYEVTEHEKKGERWFRSTDFDLTFGGDYLHVDYRRGSNTFHVEFKNGKRRVLLIDAGDQRTKFNPSAIVVGEQASLPDGLKERFSELSSQLPTDLRKMVENALF